MKPLLTAILIAGSLLLSACQTSGITAQTPSNGATSGQPVKTQDPQQNESAPPPQKPSEAAPQENKTQSQPVRTPSAFEKPTHALSKDYAMNKVYNIVPKNAEGNKKVVLLTFDDGPKERKMLEPMLDILDKHKAKAIFFVNGYRVKKNPDLLKLLYERNHAIGNHSWDHIDLKKEPADKIKRQILDVQTIVKEITGKAPLFFRPPFGSSNDEVKSLVKQEKMLFMNWSNGSEDWVANKQNKESVVKRVMEQLHPGSNILMHELPWTVEALDELLSKIEQSGYAFVDPFTIETPQ